MKLPFLFVKKQTGGTVIFQREGFLNSQHERLSYLGQICQFRNATHYSHDK